MKTKYVFVTGGVVPNKPHALFKGFIEAALKNN